VRGSATVLSEQDAMTRADIAHLIAEVGASENWSSVRLEGALHAAACTSVHELEITRKDLHERLRIGADVEIIPGSYR
jgi:hypothetical protein